MRLTQLNQEGLSRDYNPGISSGIARMESLNTPEQEELPFLLSWSSLAAKAVLVMTGILFFTLNCRKGTEGARNK